MLVVRGSGLQNPDATTFLKDGRTDGGRMQRAGSSNRQEVGAAGRRFEACGIRRRKGDVEAKEWNKNEGNRG